MIDNPLTKAKVVAPLLFWSEESGLKNRTISKMRAELNAPAAKKSTTLLQMHGHSRQDDYFWLRNREDHEVISYLEAENTYLENVMAPLKRLREGLYQEMKGFIREDEESVPYKLDQYYYYTRFEQGGEYPLHCRRKGSMEAPEEVIVNGNALARGKAFCFFTVAVSPDHSLAAILEDSVGRRFYNIRFKDVASGRLLPDLIKATTRNLVWANDNKTVYYVRQDPQTLRSCRVYKHVLGTPASKDELVFEEKDSTFSCRLSKTKSGEYIIIKSYSTHSSESRVLRAGNPETGFLLVQAREKDHLYSVEHHNDKFYILTNLDAINFKLVEAPLASPGKSNWQDVLPHRRDVLLEGIAVFKNYLVVEERREGLSNIRIISWKKDRQEQLLSFNEPTYAVYLAENHDFNSDVLRFDYSSLTIPNSTYAYDMDSRQKKLLKRQVVPHFEAGNYRSERIMVTARDGVKVPVSLVYHKDTPRNGTAPCLQYAYGSYGRSIRPYFNPSRLSLLNRGFVFAIAHVRGGQEMGRQWYEDGKLLKKKNTFHDFIACSEYLIKRGYAAKDKLFAMGGSAGGMLMSVVANMRPDLYKGIIAAVPFVDAVTTMLDESIPLTTSEYYEWGNPGLKEFYDCILSYSPYDNIKDQDYPNILVTAGLHDSQVQYWEPAKYVAKLRAKKTDDNVLLLHTNMTAGHEGATGRFESLKEIAMGYAFLLDLAGKAEAVQHMNRNKINVPGYSTAFQFAGS
ncbi:S9 family peptidase [Cesiribacter sp. SM1]|uniref:S9 family peptidase n=1 Tax=Cesiribacter sp. SM1 TaxID=2861196 RepID=UPI001CD1ADA1|nr:S9 family peptidase [Cesiribacter sp. SM1]